MKKIPIWFWQIALLVALFVLWHVATEPGLIPPIFFDNENRAAFFFGEPTKIFSAIWVWFSGGEIYPHLWVTLQETVLAFVIGTLLGLARTGASALKVSEVNLNRLVDAVREFELMTESFFTTSAAGSGRAASASGRTSGSARDVQVRRVGARDALPKLIVQLLELHLLRPLRQRRVEPCEGERRRDERLVVVRGIERDVGPGDRGIGVHAIAHRRETARALVERRPSRKERRASPRSAGSTW